MFGFSNAGKTTILYQLKLNRAVVTTHTYMFNMETIQIAPSGKEFIIWDYSGSSVNVRNWYYWLEDGDGLIFVIDSVERERFAEARNALLDMCRGDDNTPSGIVLLLCNKQDLPGAASVEEIKDMLRLDDFWWRGRRWHIRGVSGVTGEGIWEGLEWMETQLQGPAIPCSHSAAAGNR
jgi:ADP-ribosylation factor protein 1